MGAFYKKHSLARAVSLHSLAMWAPDETACFDGLSVEEKESINFSLNVSLGQIIKQIA